MRSIRTGLLGAAMAMAIPFVGVATPTPASASSQDITAIVIDGVGFGHGRGMSQWGAYGWAVQQGKSWQWILDHYFGGTVLADVDTSQTRIKVRLLGLDGLGTVGVLSHGAGVTWNGQTRASMYARETTNGTFEIYGSSSIACPTGSTLTVPSGNPTIAQGSSNYVAVAQIQQFLEAFQDPTIAVDGSFGPQTARILRDWQAAQGLAVDGVWHPQDAIRAASQIGAGGGASWSLLGSQSGTVRFTTPTGENSAENPTAVLGACSSSGAVTHYRGAIEVSSQSDGNRVVNDVKTEDYLRGVVPKEVSASWANAGGGAGANAVRAQAVAARSYGLQQNRYPPYASTCDSMACQVYSGSATRATSSGTPVLVEDSRTDQAIVATAGKVRRWISNGAIASTEFSASNGPRTAGGAFTPVDDILGDGVANNPNHRWTRIIDASVLESTYGLGQLAAASMTEAASSTYRQFDGIWFNDIVLSGTAGGMRMQAWDFRRAFNLPSPGFTVRVIRDDTTPDDFALIGDSVGNSIAHAGSSELRRMIDGTFASATIDVVDGRCTTRISCPGTSGVEVANSLPTGVDVVVVELGYNDSASGFAADIAAMMAALEARNVGRVVWVNMADIRTSGGSSVYGPMNAALTAAAAQRSNLTVLDWNAATFHPEARARWFTDGVHLTTTGQAEFALWLRAQVLGQATAEPTSGLQPARRLFGS